jgi:hypothetical protein
MPGLRISAGPDDDGGVSETPPVRRGRPPRRKPVPEPTPEPAYESTPAPPPVEPTAVVRGPVTPAQYGDDGWGGLPVQMRP